MIPRIFGFLRSSAGKMLAFTAITFFAFLFVGKVKQKRSSNSRSVEGKLPTIAGSTNGIRGEVPSVQAPVSSVKREFKAFRPSVSDGSSSPKTSEEVAKFVPATRLVHSYEAETNLPAPTVPVRGHPLAQLPPGLLIPCRLFNGIESNLPETPLVAKVTLDVKVHGSVLVPRGSEIHGVVRADQRRTRVMTGSSWQVVTPANKLIRLEGIGLNREYDPRKDVYGRHDGIAGIEGEVIRQDSQAAKGLFVASAVSAAGKLGQQRNATLLGSEIVPTMSNGMLGGASAVMDRYAAMKLKEVEQNQPYIRVPAGSEFYVYTQKPVAIAEPREPRQEGGALLERREALLKQLQQQVGSTVGAKNN